MEIWCLNMSEIGWHVHAFSMFISLCLATQKGELLQAEKTLLGHDASSRVWTGETFALEVCLYALEPCLVAKIDQICLPFRLMAIVIHLTISAGVAVLNESLHGSRVLTIWPAGFQRSNVQQGCSVKYVQDCTSHLMILMRFCHDKWLSVGWGPWG